MHYAFIEEICISFQSESVVCKKIERFSKMMIILTNEFWNLVLLLKLIKTIADRLFVRLTDLT